MKSRKNGAIPGDSDWVCPTCHSNCLKHKEPETKTMRVGFEEAYVKKFSSDKILLTAQELRDIILEAQKDMWDTAEAGRIRVMELEDKLQEVTKKWLTDLRERDELKRKEQ